MSTKQELMNMMENRLPSEAVLSKYPLENPPTYPDVERATYASQQYMEQQQNDQATGQIYTIQPTQVIAIQSAKFGTRSHLAYCPSCHSTRMTRCEYENSMLTHIVAAVLCFTTCSCCLPYLFDNCKSARHYCQDCGSYLGAYTK